MGDECRGRARTLGPPRNGANHVTSLLKQIFFIHLPSNTELSLPRKLLAPPEKARERRRWAIFIRVFSMIGSEFNSPTFYFIFDWRPFFQKDYAQLIHHLYHDWYDVKAVFFLEKKLSSKYFNIIFPLRFKRPDSVLISLATVLIF